jgi:hypothetical protein
MEIREQLVLYETVNEFGLALSFIDTNEVTGVPAKQLFTSEGDHGQDAHSLRT